MATVICYSSQTKQTGLPDKDSHQIKGNLMVLKGVKSFIMIFPLIFGVNLPVVSSRLQLILRWWLINKVDVTSGLMLPTSASLPPCSAGSRCHSWLIHETLRTSDLTLSLTLLEENLLRCHTLQSHRCLCWPLGRRNNLTLENLALENLALKSYFTKNCHPQNLTPYNIKWPKEKKKALVIDLLRC